MTPVPFTPGEMALLREAVAIAEDLVSDHFKFSTSEWKRSRYDIQSLADLSPDEVTEAAFAQIRRYGTHPQARPRGSVPRDYFKICLQDHVIRRALERDPHIRLLPLALYIVTHELIHVVRFSRFLHGFHASPPEQGEEESRVHGLTCALLSRLSLPGVPEVVAAYRDAAGMETLESGA